MLKKHRIIYIIVAFCLWIGTLHAQNSKEVAVTGSQLSQLTQAISKAHQQLKTLSADFSQEKKSALFTETIVQKGSFWYKAPKQLRWEYKSPKALTLLFDEKKVTLLTEKGPIDNPNRMLNELGKMIINTINGNNMNDNENFDISFLKNINGKYIVVLNPVNKKIKANYNSIQVILNAQDYLAEEVIMNESNGDVTTIIFSNKKINQSISADKFSK